MIKRSDTRAYGCLEWTETPRGMGGSVGAEASVTACFFLWPGMFACLFCLPSAPVFTLSRNPKQEPPHTHTTATHHHPLPNRAASECGPLPSHGFMKANTIPGSSASFVPTALSHEFNPAISIDFHCFNLVKGRGLLTQVSQQSSYS